MMQPAFTAGFVSSPSKPVKPQLAPSPRAYVQTGATSAQKHTNQKWSGKKARSYSTRYSASYRTKKKLLAAFERLGEDDLAARFRLCGSKFSWIHCGRHVVAQRPHFRCDHRLCPFCAPRRSRRIFAKYFPKACAFVRHAPTPVTPCHLVLTLKHRRGETAAEMRERLESAFKKLTRRKLWGEYFAGGLRATEAIISENDGCWHVHIHSLVFRRRFFDIGLLKAEWFAVTGDSDDVFLERKDLRSGLTEVLKYISKPIDVEVFTDDHIRQLLELKGKRMFAAFGEFAKFCETFEPSDNDDQADDVAASYCEGDACPLCGDPLVETVISAEESAGFLRRLEAVPKSGQNSS